MTSTSLTRRRSRTARAAQAMLAALLALLPSIAGCPVPQDQDTPVDQKQYKHPGTGHSYWLYKPSTYRDDTPAPLIISCHGTPPFDVNEHHIREWKMLAEQNGCIVATPNLQATDGIFGDGPVSGMLECEQRIMSLISLLGYQYNIDRGKIMITGFSGGGFPTYWVGLRHPEVFSTVVARNCNFSEGNLDGWIPQGDAARRPRVKIYYGSNDPITIIVQSRVGIRYLRSKGYQVESQVLPGKGHQRQPEVAMEFFTRPHK